MKYYWVNPLTANARKYGTIVSFVDPRNTKAGAVNEMILEQAGTYYHDQLAALKLENLAVHRIQGPAGATAQFNDVVFVVDCRKHAIERLVYNALVGARNTNIFTPNTIMLPLLRTDMRYEKNVEDLLRGYNTALSNFASLFRLSTFMMSVEVVLPIDQGLYFESLRS